MKMISYSTNNEDVMINRAFAGIDNGTYIDVGAFKPIHASNTYALYSRGWSGVACDPIFNFEIGWVQEWTAIRPRDKVVRDAIGSKQGETEFWLCNYRGLSTCDRESIEKHIEYNSSNHCSDGSKVPVSTLDKVIEKLLGGNAPHLICIDVEGMESQVIEGIDLVRYRPWLFVIESYFSAGLKPHFPLWEPTLMRAGYSCVWDDRVNRFYLSREHNDMLEQFQYPPNVTDQYIPHREYELQHRLEEYESNRSTLLSLKI
jgi:FkbM family methyltransferase